MADWIAAQRKAFLRWANSHLKATGKQIDSIQTGFQDGKLLCKLISILTGEKVSFPNKKCKMEIHMLENINSALHYLTDKRGIRLVGIGAKDVYDGSEKLILGLLWTIILRLEISEFSIDGIAGKKGLLLWCQRVTDGYPRCGKSIKNFSNSWKHGLGFCAIIHHFRPDCLDFDALDQSDAPLCCDTAIAAATELGIPALLETADLVETKPDEKIVMTYVAEYFKKFAASEAAEAKVKAIRDAVHLTMQHEKLMEEYSSLASEFSSWVDGETVEVEAMEPGVSVEELEEQQAAFEKYLAEEKPQRQQELFRVDNSLLSLQQSQRNNGRPIYQVEDENLAPAELSRKWETLCQMQGDLDRKISQLKNKYHQYSFMVSNFDAKAEAVDKWAQDTQNNLETVAHECEGDATANALKQKLEAHSRYAEQVPRYDSIMEDLQNLVVEVEPPYIDAERITNRFGELQNQLHELSEYAAGYQTQAQEELNEVEAAAKLVRDYCKTAENFAFEADTLSTRIGNQRAGDTEAVCEAQIASNADAASTVEKLDADYAGLSEKAQQLDETGKSADIPPGLTLDVLEEKLNALRELLQEKSTAVEQALEEARTANATKLTNLRKEHAETADEYANQVTELLAWIAEQRQRFERRDRADLGTTTSEVDDKGVALGEYRNGPKPEHLAKLYDLETKLGSLRTSQSQNQLEVYEPPAEQSTAAVKQEWSSLEEQEVAFDNAIQQCIADYRSMKRATAACDTKVGMVMSWIESVNAVFSDTSEPASGDRVAALEDRLGQYRKYKKQASRYQTVAKEISDLAASVEEPYHTKSHVDAAAQEVKDAISALAVASVQFASATNKQLKEEKALLAQAKQYKDAAEDLLFSLEEEEKRVDGLNDSSSPKKGGASANDLQRALSEHDERGSMLDRELEDALPFLQQAADDLQAADRAEYVPEGLDLESIQKRVDSVRQKLSDRSQDLAEQLATAEQEGSSAAAALQSEHETQREDFEGIAAEIKEWIAAKHESFENDRKWVAVEECAAAVEALGQYRSDVKPQKQLVLFGLEGRVGRLISSQRQNNLPEYQPSEDLSPAALITAWEALQGAEVEYEASLLDTLDRYTKMQAAYEEFTSTSDLILHWAEEKQAIFDTPVDEMEAYQPPAEVLAAVNARLANYNTFTDQWSRYEPLKKSVVDVSITKIAEPFEHAAGAAAAHAHLDEVLDKLQSTGADYGDSNWELQQEQQADLDLSQKHAHEAETTLFQLRLVRDDLNTPVNEASVAACEDAIEVVQEISGTKLAGIRTTVEGDLSSMHDELKGKPNSAERQLLQEAHDNGALRQQVDDLAAAAEEEAARLQAALAAAKEKEAAAKEFADAANAFAALIKTCHGSLADIEGSPEERKSAILDVQLDVESHEKDVAVCRELDEKCRGLGVTANSFTTETQHSVESLYESLVKLIASMLNEIEGQIAAASAGKLDPATIKSLNKLYKEFDDGSGLGFQEFYECCNACGLVINEKQAKKLFSPYETESGGKISWDEFRELMENELGSGTTLEDVTSSFRDLAEGKDTISDEAVSTHFGSDAPVHAYMTDKMVDGDYTTFSNDVFSH